MCDNQFGELKYFKTKKTATNRDQLAKLKDGLAYLSIGFP